MAIYYRSQGQPILASYWNQLFAELDSKLTGALSSKSFYLDTRKSAGAYARVEGRRFLFGTGSRPFSSGLGSLYSHSIFTAKVAAVDPLDIVLEDATAKLVTINDADWHLDGVFLRNSLEAHQIEFTSDVDPEPHWILEPGANRPERFYRYAQAELIFEGLTTYTWPVEYNKYGMFRVHNLHTAAIEITFPGHVLTVPPFCCRCIRRIWEAGAWTGWEAGWNYFHRFRNGDLTLFEMPHVPADGPWGAMGANNVISPRLGWDWLAILSVDSTAGPRWYKDPHATYDVGSIYSEHFPT